MGKEQVKLPLIGHSEYTNANRLIHSGPCIVKSVHISAAGANSYCHVYDGLNAKGKFMAHVEALSGSSYTWRPGDGTDFDLGLYIVVSVSNAKVTVTYIPESRKNFI